MNDNAKRIAVYCYIPPRARINDTQIVSEINKIKDQCRQCGLVPIHTFVDRSKTGTMYKTVTDYAADPQNNVAAFLCYTIGGGFPDFTNKNVMPLSEEQADKPNAERFTGGGVPYGYMIDGNGALTVDEDKAVTVRAIFQAKAEGNSYQKIADLLNAEGKKSGRGGEWSKQGVSFVLKNTAYVGEYNSGGKIHNIPKLISRQLFNKCQRA